MVKKCNACGKNISVKDGHYVNAYGDPWQMKSYHAECYRELILRGPEGDEAP